MQYLYILSFMLTSSWKIEYTILSVAAVLESVHSFSTKKECIETSWDFHKTENNDKQLLWQKKKKSSKLDFIEEEVLKFWRMEYKKSEINTWKKC